MNDVTKLDPCSIHRLFVYGYYHTVVYDVNNIRMATFVSRENEGSPAHGR